MTWQRGNVAASTLNTYREGGIDHSIQPYPGNPGVTARLGSDIATDPAHPATIYAVTQAAGDDFPADSDLFVFRSQDGGATYPTVDRLRLDDPGLPTGTRRPQFMAGICVDAFGGVNILHYEAIVQTPAPTQLQARYLRITNYNTPQMQIFVAPPLTPLFTVPVPPAPSGYTFIGDYQMIATSGCYVYPCYMSTHSGKYYFYVNRIYLPECAAAVAIADFNHDTLVDPVDAVGFGVALLAGSPSADVNHDQAVNASDMVAFQEAYNTVTNP